MKRPLFNLLSAVSLSLAVATCALWVWDWQWVAAADSGCILICYCGGAGGADFLRKSDSTPERAHNVFRYLHLGPPPWHPAFGAGTRTGPRRGYNFRYWWISMPDWTLTVAFTVLPAIWVARRYRTRRRASTRRCIICGYDLRATPGRCPECGKEPAAVVQSRHA